MRRPWNIINSPVYSLATYDKDQVNMNICTYVSAISMNPKQYAIAVYYATKTFENLKQGFPTVLQILNQQNISLIKPLGKSSGLKKDKQAYLQKHQALIEWNGYQVLASANAYIELDTLTHLHTAGDHELFIFNIKKHKTVREDKVLMFQDLIEAKVIL